MEAEKLKAKLGLDNSEFKRGLKDSESQLSKISYCINRLGGLIRVAFSVSAIRHYVGEETKVAA